MLMLIYVDLSQKEADEKYLAALKSVVKCLEDNKIDFTKLLPGWQLKAEISKLEKDVAEANKKIEDKVVQKRKVDKHDSSNKLKIPEPKRSRFTVKDSSLVSPSVTLLHEQRIAAHIQDGNISYDGSLAAYLLDSRLSNNYPTAISAQLGSVAGTLPENVLGGTVASGGMLGAVASAGMSAGISPATGSFPGYHRDMVIDKVGTMLNSNSQLHRWHGIGEGALANERPVGQSAVAQPVSARMNSLYGLSPSVEGFTGLPDHPSIGVASHSGGSDLYGFADAV
ncbi:hypothetical protein L6164_014956 [Bauhinia variegata]|uniref:Uncharacterized protein n=1 Tax=Bauhinia variegata TaxID=167791 RepID=A0ACB9NJR1_BAUVA|nr:hypothetical protein L6164_014956 [Bauhinia variegata]